MNYIKEINAFYDWLETNSLSTSEIALWHALMHINNKSGWAEEFTVATSVLCIKTGLADRTIRDTRNKLKQKGRIDFRSRKGNQSAIYKMISLVEVMPAISSGNKNREDKRDDLPEIDADSSAGNHADKCADSNAGNHATLYKLNETKLNDINTSTTTELEDNFKNDFDEEFKELTQLYQKCGFEVNGFTADWILDLKNRFGFEWVKNAVLEAERQGKRSKKYVEGILKNWKVGGGMKLSTDQNQTQKNQSQSNSVKKTRFHNFKQQTDKYSADDLEDIARRKREEYFKKVQDKQEVL